MYCLDSDFLIAVLRRHPEAAALLPRLEREGRLAISAITAFEVTDSRYPARRQQALDALATLDIIPVDGSVAVAASAMGLALRGRGLEVPMPDLLIAATSLLGDLTLVTRNERHFGRMPKLRLRGW